jgi:predicted nucleotidyltransferase
VKTPPLTPAELELLRSVFRRHPEIRTVKLFGSRAKGTHTARSDIDLALWGEVDALRSAAIAAELDELPLPYTYDVRPFASLSLPSLREHIERVGVAIYPESGDQSCPS